MHREGFDAAFSKETEPSSGDDGDQRGGYSEVRIPHSQVLSPKTRHLLKGSPKTKKNIYTNNTHLDVKYTILKKVSTSQSSCFRIGTNVKPE